jgi:hypothetical protein
MVYVGHWPYCPHQSIFPRRVTQADPIVIFRNAKGDISFPGRANEPVPKRLEKLGYVRVEIPFHQAHKLEKEMNVKEKLRYEKAKQKEYEIFGQRRRELNAELRQRAQHFSPEGQEMVRECMRRYDEKSSCPKYDPGFHIDVLHNDSSSRLPWIDKDTNWRPRRD